MLSRTQLSWAIVIRNWTVYRKDLLANLSPTFTEPGLTLLALGVGLGAFVTDVEGRTFVQFLAPGLVAATALFTAFFEASYGFYIRMQYEHIFKAMLTSRIGPVEVTLGEFWWYFIKGAIMTSGVTFALAVFGVFEAYELFPLVAFLGGLTAIPCAALGLISTGFVKNVNQFQVVFSFIIAPMYFLSGVFFPVSHTPEWFQKLVHISPLFHGARSIQMVFWNEIDFSMMAYHVGALIVFSLILGGFAHRTVKRKLIS